MAECHYREGGRDGDRNWFRNGLGKDTWAREAIAKTWRGLWRKSLQRLARARPRKPLTIWLWLSTYAVLWAQETTERWWAKKVRARPVLHCFMGYVYPTPQLTINALRAGILPTTGCD